MTKIKSLKGDRTLEWVRVKRVDSVYNRTICLLFLGLICVYTLKSWSSIDSDWGHHYQDYPKKHP